MTATTQTLTGKLAGLGTAARLVIAVVGAVVVATVANAIIAAIAHGAGVSHAFVPLQFGTYTGLTVLGTLLGGLGWTIVRSRSTNAAALLRRLVPAVLLVSFVPDIAIGASHSEAHTTWGGVAALMVMHLAVGASAVAAFVTALPVSAAPAAHQSPAVTATQA